MVKTFYTGVSLLIDLFPINFNTRHIHSVSTIRKFVQNFERCANISVESGARGRNFCC
jgi:hypothetical protein